MSRTPVKTPSAAARNPRLAAALSLELGVVR
jgi:hypothetical protein